MNREQLIETLSSKVLNVTFEKKDGTLREMTCTLDEGMIPEEKRPKGTGERKVNEEVLSVFDLNIKEWRSFRIDSLKEIL